MKQVLIIAIVAVTMIGIMIPSAFAGTYVNEGNYEFSIDYPYGWEMLEEEYPNLVSFSDKYDWTTAIFVSHWEDAGEQLTDDEEIDWMFELLEDQCVNDIVGTTGINCFNFQRYDDTAMVYEINGYRAITVMTSNTNQYGNPDYPGNYPMVWTFTHIYDGYDVWQIHSTSKDYVFEDHYSSILETIQSFRILHPHEDTKRLESESFKLEIRENDDLVPKDVDFIFATDSLSYDEKLHRNCSNLQDIFETLGANNFRTMFATDADAQRCLVKTSEELERIEELTTTNSVFIIITDKLKNKGYVELFFDEDLIQSFSFTEDELEKRIELKYAFPDYYEEYTLTAINGDYFTSVLWTPLPSLSAIDKYPNLELIEKTDETKSILIEEISDVSKSKEIPSWVKNNAGWWADGTIDDNSFVQGIQFLVKEGIIAVDSTSQGTEESKEIPTWIKNNAGWWANDDIDDDAFITGIEFLVKEGIIAVD